jgi:hypothetical protein
LSAINSGANARGGIGGALTRVGVAARAAVTIARLFVLPAVHVAPRENVRMAPAW